MEWWKTGKWTDAVTKFPRLYGLENVILWGHLVRTQSPTPNAHRSQHSAAVLCPASDLSDVVCSASLERVFCTLKELPSRKDFLVIRLNFPFLAFIPLLIFYNLLACFSLVKWPWKPASSISASRFHASYPFLSVPISHHFLFSMCPWCYPAGTKGTPVSKACACRAGRSTSELTGASKNPGQDPANSIPEEIRLLGSRHCLLCSQL